MTRYQIVATKDTARILVGDPYEFMSLAEVHAEELRNTLRLVPHSENVVLTVEPAATKEA